MWSIFPPEGGNLASRLNESAPHGLALYHLGVLHGMDGGWHIKRKPGQVGGPSSLLGVTVQLVADHNEVRRYTALVEPHHRGEDQPVAGVVEVVHRQQVHYVRHRRLVDQDAS